MILLGIEGLDVGLVPPAVNLTPLPVGERASHAVNCINSVLGGRSKTDERYRSHFLNGVPSFKKPPSKNASDHSDDHGNDPRCILCQHLRALAVFFKTDPTLQQTIVSQLGWAIYGNSILYYVLQFTMMGILVVAANTAFAGFPTFGFDFRTR